MEKHTGTPDLRKRGISSFVVFLVAASGLTAPAVAASTHQQVMKRAKKNIAYHRAEEYSQFANNLDIHPPTIRIQRKSPVIVWIHGGVWKGGAKGWDRLILPKIPWMNAQGFMVVSINHRDANKFPFPAPIIDTARAISWIQKNISRHGGNPRNIILIGHSSGAHLAVLVATHPTHLKKAGGNPEEIAAVVALDFPAYDTAGQFGEMSFFEIHFGGDMKAMKDASPMLHVGGHVAPAKYLFVQGEPSAEIREDSAAMVAKLKAAGVWAERVQLPQYGHSEISQKLGNPGEEITATVGSFLANLKISSR